MKRFLVVAFLAAVSGRGVLAQVEDVRVIDRLKEGGPYQKIWQPFIARVSAERLVATYGLQLVGKGDMGDIVASVSRDGGKTWGPRIAVFDHRVRYGPLQYAYNNSVLFRPEGQDVIWCFAMRTPMQYRDSEDARLCAAYSADGGLSWIPVELANDYHMPLITCAGVVTLRDGDSVRYLLPVHRNTRRRDETGDRRQLVLESTNLLRWKLSGYVPQPTDGTPVWIHEGNIAPGDRDDELKIVMRTTRCDSPRIVMDPPVAWSSVSRDGGRTWSPAVAEPSLPNFRSKAFFGKDAKGRHVYVYSHTEAREGLYYKVKPKGGAWSDAKLFFDGETRNSYPTLLEESPGHFLAVWDSSDDPRRRRTVIRFGRLDVNAED
jgi:hypothetical protein